MVGLREAVVSDMESSWGPVATSVPQHSVLVPVLFYLFIKNLDEGTECTLSKFAVDTELGGVAETPQGFSAFQWDLDRLERSPAKCIKSKFRVLHLVKSNPRHQ